MYPKLVPIISFLESLRHRADLQSLESVLRDNPITPKDIITACLFHEKHYCRNKVKGSDWYDLYIMCWKPGQHSTIHDHAESSCALQILQGTATEIACELTNIDKCLVRATNSISYPVHAICATQDSQIHQIRNDSEDQNLITMHIYSPPLKMNIYGFDPAHPLSLVDTTI